MTTTELTTAYNVLTKRLDQLEQLVKGAVGTPQLNAVTLLLEKEITSAKADVDSLKERVTTLEGVVEGIT